MLLLPPQQAAEFLGCLRSRGLCWLLWSKGPSLILELDFRALRTLMAHMATTRISWLNSLLLLISSILRSICAGGQRQQGS